MSQPVTIDKRFNGPPTTGNGGYVAGVVAALVGGSAQVTLRVPPPLDTPFQVARDGDVVRLMDGDTIVAEGVPAEVELDVPDAPSLDEAADAVERYTGFDAHTFPTCFVCGPERGEGDGLRIFAGAVNGRDIVAAPWTPHESLAVNGALPTEVYWAALDCPGAFAVAMRDTPVVLGRIAAEVVGTAKPGEKCVVIGWGIGQDGRKHFAGTAIFGEDGQLVAKASQTWIEVRQ